jgi:hypothetical protein
MRTPGVSWESMVWGWKVRSKARRFHELVPSGGPPCMAGDGP